MIPVKCHRIRHHTIDRSGGSIMTSAFPRQLIPRSDAVTEHGMPLFRTDQEATGHWGSGQSRSAQRPRLGHVSRAGHPRNCGRQVSAPRPTWPTGWRVPAPVASRSSVFSYCLQTRERFAREPRPKSGFRQSAPSVRSGSSRLRTRRGMKPGTRHLARSTKDQSAAWYPDCPVRGHDPPVCRRK